MKKFREILLALFILNLSFPVDVKAQVWVEEKPIPPKIKSKMPEKPGYEYVLLPGRWVWHRPSKRYVWISPAWVVPPRGKSWSSGFWKSENHGWIWVPGKWKRKTGILARKNKSLTS